MAETWLLRDPGVVALVRGGTCLFIVPDRAPIVMNEIDTEALGRVLAAAVVPAPRSVLSELSSDEALDVLLEEGVLVAGGEEELRARIERPRPKGARPCRRVTVAITGSINSVRAYEHVLTIARNLADEVDVIVTRSAMRFMRPRIFRYFGLRTWTEPYGTQPGVRVPHMHLASADLVVVAPASAASLARLASGACSDLVSLVVAATESPVVVAPAMNARMWRNPAIARNVAQLRADGIWVAEPRAGFAVSEAEPHAEMGRMGFDVSNVLATLSAVLQARAAEARGA